MAIQQILAKPGAKVMAKLKISNGAVAMFCRDLLHLKAGKPLLPPPFLVAPRTLSVPDLRHRRAEAPAGALPLTEQLPRTGLPPSAASVHLHPVCALSLSLSATTGWATAAAAADAQRQVPRPSSVSSLVTSTHQVFPTLLFPCGCAKPSTQTLT